MAPPLTRTTSYLILPGLGDQDQPTPTDPPQIPYHRTLRYYKEQRDRRKGLLYHSPDPLAIHTKADCAPPHPAIRVRLPNTTAPTTDAPITIRIPPKAPRPTTAFRISQHSAAAPAAAAAAAPPPARATSPLAPTRTPLPPRTAFPRSKPEPDLYRKAITARMRGSPEGQKILLMGPRLALSILTATRELERIVAQQCQAEREDVAMAEAAVPDAAAAAGVGVGAGMLGNSWVFVPGEDWEMVDCGA